MNEGLKYVLPRIVLVAAVLVLAEIVATATLVAAAAQATTAVGILPLLQLLLLLVQARAPAVDFLRHRAGHLQPSLPLFYLFSF
jgi:hypothetical protein